MTCPEQSRRISTAGSSPETGPQKRRKTNTSDRGGTRYMPVKIR